MKTKIILAVLSVLVAVPIAFANHPDMKEEIMKCDQNKDGAISKQEFMDSKEEKFKDADDNSDGKLSSAEIDDMIKDKKEQHKKS